MKSRSRELNRHINDYISYAVKNEKEILNGKVLVANYVFPSIIWNSTIMPYHILKKSQKDNSIESNIKRQNKLLARTKKKVEQLEELKKELTEHDVKEFIDFKGQDVRILYPTDVKKMEDDESSFKLKLKELTDLNMKYKRDIEIMQTDMIMQKYIDENKLSQTKPTDIIISMPINVIVEERKNISTQINANQYDNRELTDLNDTRSKETRIPKLEIKDVIKKYYLNEMRMSELIRCIEDDIKLDVPQFVEKWAVIKNTSGRTFAIKSLIEFYKLVINNMNNIRMRLEEQNKQLLLRFSR